jgi:hypothetical protein
LWGDFLNWDDDAYLYENPAVISSQGWREMAHNWTRDANVYPVVLASFRFEYQLWGLDPSGYRAVNLVLHGVVSLLVFGLFRRMGVPVPLAWWAALLFAVHPFQVATVAWVSERKSLLGCFFLLLALIAALTSSRPGFVRRREEGTDQTGGMEEEAFHRSRFLAALSFPLAILAYLSKSSLVVFPLLLAATFWTSSRLSAGEDTVDSPSRIRWGWIETILVAAHLLLAAVFGWIYSGREIGPELPFSDRLSLVPQTLSHYLLKYLVPINLGGIDPTLGPGWRAWQVWVSISLLTILGALMFRYRTRLGPVTVWGAFWFLIAIGPSLGMLRFGYQRHSFTSDHLAYLAVVGLTVPFVSVVDRFTPAKPYLRNGFLGGVVAIWMGLSFLNTFHWLNPESFWSWTLKKNPQSWVAHLNYATYLDTQGETEEAVEHYRRSVEIAPSDPVGWINYGRILIKEGDYAAAKVALEKARDLNPDYPQIDSLLSEAWRRARDSTDSGPSTEHNGLIAPETP